MNFPFKLRENQDFDVLGFGTNAVDILIRVPEYPAYNSKVELIDYQQAAGGEIATAMVGLQRLGLRTKYAGRFGGGQTGVFGLRSLRDEGVDLGSAEVIESAVTQTAFIIIDDRTGERTVIWKRDAGLAYSADDAPTEALEDVRVLHMTPHDTDACIRLAAAAKKLGVIVSLDIDNVFDRVDELLHQVDILIMSADFPEKLLGTGDQRAALEQIASRFGSQVAGITLGESGSLVFCGGQFIRSPGFPVPGGCRDTTGAGDSFRVGFLFGLLSGESVENACRMANAVAALKCRAVGARTSLPVRKELDQLLASQP